MAAIGEELEEIEVVPEPEFVPEHVPQEPSPKQQPAEPARPELVPA